MTDQPITPERVRALVAIARNQSRPVTVRMRAADDILDMCDPDYVATLAQPLAPRGSSTPG
ncbi:hypothetical protein HP546_19050 [Pseudomonas sp. CM25]|uniref:hypothetical protein n=1 Tax=Pseudomonas sp. CM25 TaxID=2738448 RepID=UPI00155163B1|nr:hypothetical protein [Pseudomonas sp. CM25]NQD57437.1 hypothetical protein [Pseudomonas sp. CM25]